MKEEKQKDDLEEHGWRTQKTELASKTMGNERNG